MKKLSHIALGAALALGVAGTSLTVASPAFAQKKKEKAPEGPKLSKQVQANLAEAQKLITAQDYPGALARIQAADAIKSTPDDAYMVNALKINVAQATKDNAMLEQALEGALASGRVPPETAGKFTRALGGLAVQRNDFPKAIQAFERVVQANPNDSDAIAQLAELYQRNKQTPQAVATLSKAIAAMKASGQTVPENWYKRQLAIAYDAKLANEVVPSAAALVTAYPTPTNWRDSVIIVRDMNKINDDQVNLDAFRLMRAANALTGERDYIEYAETAAQRGLPGEAKSVLDEGIAKGAVQTGKQYVKDLQALTGPKIKADQASLTSLERDARGAKGTGKGALATGDGYLGYGNWAKAAEMYQLALQKGGVDAATVNTRLGIAHARAGQKAEAEAAFKAVNTGPRAQLAQLWMAWVNRAA